MSSFGQVALQQILEINLYRRDSNPVPRSSEPCMLTNRLTHAAQKRKAPNPSQLICGSFPGRASLTYSSGTLLPEGFNPLGPQLPKWKAQRMDSWLSPLQGMYGVPKWIRSIMETDHYYHSSGQKLIIDVSIIDLAGRSTDDWYIDSSRMVQTM